MIIFVKNNMIKEGRIEPIISGLKIYMWIGANKTSHHKRIKISNKRHKFDERDCFSLSIPKFEIVAGSNKILNEDELLNVISFIQLNIETIDSYYDGILDNYGLYEVLIPFKPSSINEYYEHNYKSYKNILGKFKDCYLTDSDSEYMDRFNENFHRISNILMYIGQSSNPSDSLVKISNNSKVFDADIFTIDVLKKEIRGKVKIEIETLHKIIEFIENNRKSIIEYSCIETCSITTGEFKNNLIFQ